MPKSQGRTLIIASVVVLLLLAIFLSCMCWGGSSTKKENFNARRRLGFNTQRKREPYANYAPTRSGPKKEPYANYASAYQPRMERFEAKNKNPSKIKASMAAPFDSANAPPFEGNRSLLPDTSGLGDAHIPGVIEDGVMKVDADVTRHFSMNPPRRNMNRTVRRDPEIEKDPSKCNDFNRSTIDQEIRNGFEVCAAE